MCYDPLRFILSFSDLFTPPPPSFPPPLQNQPSLPQNFTGLITPGGTAGLLSRTARLLCHLSSPFNPHQNKQEKTWKSDKTVLRSLRHRTFIPPLLNPRPCNFNPPLPFKLAPRAICVSPPQARAGGGNICVTLRLGRQGS